MADEPIKIEIPTGGLKEVVHQYVLEQLSAEQRTTIMSQAVAHLLTPKQGHYGRGAESPLELAFNQAVEQVMHEVAREIIRESPEVRAKIKSMMGDALTQWTKADPYGWQETNFIRKMGEAIAYGFAKDD